MDPQNLIQFTKNVSLDANNDPDVLEKFMQYVKYCCDPENIFAHMEEKSICNFMPKYWIKKAEHFFNQGDYETAFNCLRQAKSRVGIIDDDTQQLANIGLIKGKMIQKMTQQMHHPTSKGKRTIDEYKLSKGKLDQLSGDEEQKQSKLLLIYKNKFDHLRKQKEIKYKLKQQNKPKSWLYEHYQEQDQKIQNIEQKIKSSNNFLKNGEYSTWYSLNTPHRKQDRMRLTKTLDSIEMLKKKKSTLLKNKNTKFANKLNKQTSFQENNDLIDSDSLIEFNSVPVGRAFTDLKRRVTFSIQNTNNFQKFRKQELSLKQSDKDTSKRSNQSEKITQSDQKNSKVSENMNEQE